MFVKQPGRRIRDARKSRVIKAQIVRRRKAESEQAEVFRRVMAQEDAAAPGVRWQ